ncbi:MAG: ABC transporter ATP-binding protein [Thermotogota bacterium]
MGNSTAVEIKDISKTFGKIQALKDVSFTFDQGEIFGLLGPNGAGKTTLVRILTTILEPDKGMIRLFGKDIQKKRKGIREIIGYVPASIILYQHLSAFENLVNAASLYGIDKKKAKKIIELLLKKFDMWEWRNEKIKNFSSGMAQKINICRGILHEPHLLILDEPTNGLDPKSRQVVRDFLLEINASGTTVLLTTHVMWSVEEICKRVAIIDNGKLIIIDSIANLKTNELNKKDDIKVFVSGLIGNEGRYKKLKNIDWILDVQHEDKKNFVITINGNDKVKELQRILLETFSTIENIKIKEPTLEDVFISLTKKV